MAPFAAGDMEESLSDSTSLILQVMVISGGADGKSSDVGLSKSLSILRLNFGDGNWKRVSLGIDDRCGGGEPGKFSVGNL